MNGDRSRTTTSVCVIGAGAAVLTSIKACLDAGFSVIAYEQTDKIGGLWNINSSSTSQTISNSSSRLSSFSDFPTPRDWPLFLPRHLVIQYLNDYAKHFNLLQHINFSCMVVRIERRNDQSYAITVSNWITGQTFTTIFDCIMICIGHHTDPNIPVIAGSHKFEGKILHSKFFDPADHDLDGKQVVVIGSGNSAGDAAVEAGDNVLLAIRTGIHIIRRTTTNGDPADEVFFRRSTQLALKTIAPLRCMRNGLVQKVNHLMHFDPKTYNIPEARHGILDQQPMINDLLLPRMISGRLNVLPIKKINKFTKDSIIFIQADHSRIAVKCDLVIYATGYRKKSQLIESLIGDHEFLYRKIFPPDNLRIGLIGHVQPLGPQFPLMEMQARFFVQMQNKRKAESDGSVKRSIARDKAESKRKGRHALTISWSKYIRSLARDMGIQPPLIRLFFTDQKTWRKLFFGPMAAEQYRMFGRLNQQQDMICRTEIASSFLMSQF